MSTIESRPFADAGQVAVQNLRRALAELLAEVGADPDQPQEMSRKFGLDKTLTWRISRLVREDDAWEAIQHIPRRPSFGILIKALGRCGAEPDRLQAVREALDEFERFIETHSGDRETLEIMSSSAGRRPLARRLEQLRKDGFLANSAIWGVQCAAQLGVHIMSPSPESPDAIDTSIVCGLMGFRRLRPDVRWTIATLAQWETGGPAQNVPRWRPLAPSAGPGGAPLLEQFCSTPVPTIDSLPDGQSRRRFMLSEGPVGNAGAATVLMGWTYTSAVSMYPSYPGEHGEHALMLNTPAAAAIQDVWMHKNLRFPMPPEVRVLSRLPGGPVYPDDAQHAMHLPTPAEVVNLGSGQSSTTLPEMPRFHEVMTWALSRLGHELRDYRVYRVRVAYPPIPSAVVQRHKLLTRE